MHKEARILVKKACTKKRPCCEIAENEKDSLAEYFIEKSAYSKALEAQRAFFIGRKGTEKTAFFIILSEEFKSVNQTHVVNLKPGSTELLLNVEVTIPYYNVANKSSFYSIWNFVIYSKTLLSVYNQLFLNADRYKDELSIKKEYGNALWKLLCI